MKLFKRVRKLVSKKPFKLGDRVECPYCKTIITLIKWGENESKTN